MEYRRVPWNAMGFPEVPMEFHGMNAITFPWTSIEYHAFCMRKSIEIQ